MNEKTPRTEERLDLLIDSPDSHVEFVDLAQVNANPERVVISFIQRLPLTIGSSSQTPASDNEQRKQSQPVRLVANIAMSWQHFARLTALMNRVLLRNKDQLKMTG
jgi:hypothetical protein